MQPHELEQARKQIEADLVYLEQTANTETWSFLNLEIPSDVLVNRLMNIRSKYMAIQRKQVQVENEINDITERDY